ncbi:MAG: GTPase HflX, partial [Chloroflexi bacterium]|nr:GTPase HflX [Chloroflexota bacterium]
IQKLPTQLVAAFRATLEEITEADLLLHIVDVTHPSAYAQAEAVLSTLEEIDANHIPVVTVLNKIDRLTTSEQANAVLQDFPDTVAISALKGMGISELLATVNQKLYETFEAVTVRLPFQEGGLLALFHDQGKVERVEHTRDSIIINGRLPGRLIARYQPYLKSNLPSDDEITDL